MAISSWCGCSECAPNRAKYQAIIDRIDVSRFSIPCRFEVVPSGRQIKFIMKVADRASGAPIEIGTASEVLPSDPVATDVIRIAYQLAKDTILHELAEQFIVDGERTYDPHKGQP